VEEEDEDTPQPPAAAANHKRGIPDITTRSEREQEHEQEHPAARRGGRRVGATELEVLDIGGREETQETPEGKVTHTRTIRQPGRAPGDVLQ
jgi:hypothetical protein